MIRSRLSDFDVVDLVGTEDELKDALLARAEPVLAEGVEVVLNAARANLSRRRGTARTAAPAGDSPEFDKGELYESLQPGKVKRSASGVRQEYGTTHPYAGLHEFGGTVTKGGVKRLYPARPYLRPAEDTTADQVTAILEGL